MTTDGACVSAFLSVKPADIFETLGQIQPFLVAAKQVVKGSSGTVGFLLPASQMYVHVCRPRSYAACEAKKTC